MIIEIAIFVGVIAPIIAAIQLSGKEIILSGPQLLPLMVILEIALIAI